MRTDGFGAQFQTILWGYLYAKLTNNDFVYTDICHIDLISNSGSIKDTENENTLEEVVEYMGFNKYCINRATISDNVNILDGGETYKFIQSNMDAVFNSDIFKSYKTFFHADKINRFDQTYMNIAVHIRTLGNFERENDRFRPGTHDVPYTYFLNCMNAIRKTHADKKLKFHIYSQGDESLFKEFVADDTILHLNEKVLDTFSDLVFADVLVTTRSSFSYLAALLSNNDIYYLEFWHTPLSHWNKLNT